MSAATDAARSAVQGFQQLGSDAAQTTADQKYDVGGATTRLSALKGIVGNLQSSVEAVDPSVTGRTSGTFTTEGQRSALISKERAPIVGDLNKQQGFATSAAQDLTQKQGLAGAMASALLSDNKQAYQRLLDQYNSSTAQDAAAEQKRQWEATQAEQKRQYDASQAEQKRQFNISAAAKSASGGSSKAAAAQKVTLNDLFDEYQPGKDNFYTEKTVIPTLISQGMSAKQAQDAAYAYRKAKFGH